MAGAAGCRVVAALTGVAIYSAAGVAIYYPLMARLWLTLWYLLAALPGPGLCCCAFHAAAAAPAEQGCPCCQADQPAPETDHTPHHCHCKDGHANEATLPAGVDPPAVAAAPIDTPAAPAEPVRLDPATPAPPFLDPGRLLRVFHILRC